MANKSYTQPAQLDKYSFLWSQTRLVIAAIALFIGGVPPVLAFNPFGALYGLISPLLTLSWIISGVASVYLLYRWSTNRQMLFGGKTQMDLIAFFVSVVSGLNLGITGLLGTNIGMTISSNQFVFFIVGVIYLGAFVHLFRRWNAVGQKIF